MVFKKTSKFDTAPLLLLLTKRDSLSNFLDLDSSIYSHWEELQEQPSLSAAQRREQEMLNHLIEWFSITNEFQRQKESEK